MREGTGDKSMKRAAIILAIILVFATACTAKVALTPSPGRALIPVEYSASVGGGGLRVLISPPGTETFTWVVLPNGAVTLHVVGRGVVLEKAAVYSSSGELLDVQEGSVYTLTVPADGLAGGVGVRRTPGGGITLTVGTESIFIPVPTE